MAQLKKYMLYKNKRKGVGNLRFIEDRYRQIITQRVGVLTEAKIKQYNKNFINFFKIFLHTFKIGIILIFSNLFVTFKPIFNSLIYTILL
jgi:hypothetical protein